MTLLGLSRWRLLRRLDTAAIEQAIKSAEAKTSGEIRVSIVGFFRGELRALAESAFDRLGMRATQARNGVLILVAPARKEFIILGDEGINASVGQSFWTALADLLSRRFASREFTAGLVEAIGRVGVELATHFPPHPDHRDVNELPDAVDVQPPGGPRKAP